MACIADIEITLHITNGFFPTATC